MSAFDFDAARFGMFVHWDHASQQGLEISWPMVGGVFALPHSGDVPVEQYHSSAATFDPVEFDAVALARLAKRAGMRYGVFTAKHHSGYTMWDSALSEFGVMQSPCGRDLVREFTDAFRAEGLGVGIYFSLSDWHHADYPAFTEDMKPYLFAVSPPFPGEERWGRFVDTMFGQMRELLSGYGPIDLVWFDGGWERPAAAWRGAELVEMMRSLQPGILINDRLPGVAGYSSPEQFVPAVAPEGRWETCLTMNESWGWNPDDTSYKSGRELVHTLCEVAGRGGNLLLNVSPMGTGAVPPEQVARLEEVGRWMACHSDAVVGTEAGLEPWQWYGPSTRVGDGTVYVHLLMRPYDAVVVRGLPTARVKAVSVVGAASGDRPLDFVPRTSILDQLTEDRMGEIRITVPPDAVDDAATVRRIDLTP
jgi:alpha-L-fucosidase